MKHEVIKEIMQQMLPILNNSQLLQLRQVMENTMLCYELKRVNVIHELDDNNELISAFISAKRIEGCSEKSLKYYRTTIDKMVSVLQKSVKQIMTEDLRIYLTDYQNNNKSSRVTIDNIRRILSSFFSWLELTIPPNPIRMDKLCSPSSV